MNTIKPYRSFTTPSLAVDFPACKLLFHAEDYTPSALSWVSRAGNIVANLAAGASKDANGVYTTVTNSVASVSGTMPTLAGYVVVVAIGKLTTGSASAGLTFAAGDTIAVPDTGPALNAAGICVNTSDVALASAAVALTGAITSTGDKACNAAYYDTIDTTSPIINRVLASGVKTDQVIPNGTGTTDSTNQILFGAALDPAIFLGCLGTTDDGRRGKIYAVFDFAVSLSIGELEIACAEMARTQELFAGWRNRASA